MAKSGIKGGGGPTLNGKSHEKFPLFLALPLFALPSNHGLKSTLNSDKSLLFVVRISKIGLICMSSVKQLFKASVYLCVF